MNLSLTRSLRGFEARLAKVVRRLLRSVGIETEKLLGSIS